MDTFFSFFWKTPIFVLMCALGAACIVAAYGIYSATLLVIGFGLLALAVMTFVWEDSKRFPEVE